MGSLCFNWGHTDAAAETGVRDTVQVLDALNAL